MGVAETPLRLEEVEEQLVAIEIDDRTPDRFSEAGDVQRYSANGDLHGSAEYRRHLLGAVGQARAMRHGVGCRRVIRDDDEGIGHRQRDEARRLRTSSRACCCPISCATRSG